MMSAKQKPNILFILLDDYGWSDTGCYGSSFYETPRLDQLAQQGARFTDAYASCPVCSPTRASILTGKYPARLGMTQWLGGRSEGKLADVPYIDHLSSDEFSLAKALKQGGYRTWHVGKWHLSQHNDQRFETYPDKHGFEINIGGCDWGHPFNGYFSPYGIETLEDGPTGEYLTDRLTDEAINLIERQDDDQPWFMYLSHYAVHTPIECHAHLVEKYRKKARMLGIDKINPFDVGEHFPCDHKKDEHVIRRTIQSDPVYAAMVENMDWNIGRVLDCLKANGLEDNTIVIFYSDNGGLATAEGSPTTNKPLCEGKGWMYEGGTREPLIVRWPGHVAANSIIETPITSTDFYPTLLECAGLPLIPQQHCDGISILPTLTGQNPQPTRELYWHYPHYSNQGCTPGCAVRDGEWKLLEFFEDNKLELYNVYHDIGETQDVSRQHPEIVASLKAKLDNWKLEVGARIPQPNPRYKP
ncbi:sulfatase [Chelonobacter oris]|uniref:Sulfatase n=1 Tax=Chelonobacter oris TaxID=505317 RepID=A0A0A3B7R9_9PAST|nr:sulfatase [Chelonobacter oris]KGQ69634.1 sulfatase [Chelonobacter oris]MDH3000290.1 sulfatase [Chelonobacter oris]